MENKSLVGLIAVILTLTGVPTAIYFYPFFTEFDTCVKSGSYGPWENVTEKVYYNETFPAIARYYCVKETTMTREDCHKQNKLINNPGCKWGGKVGGTTKLYVMEDPEVGYSLESIDSLPLVDVGIVKTEGVKMDWTEEGLTHRCLGFEISKGILTDAIAGIILDTASKEGANPMVEKKSIEKWNDTREVEDKCSTVQIGTDPNGTALMNTTCTYKIVTEAKQREAWNNVKIDMTEISAERFDGIKLSDGFYKYCFNVPFVKTANGWGNSGEVRLVLDSKILVDRQHSANWNDSWAYMAAVNITHSNSYDLPANYTLNITMDTASLISAGKLQADCDDLRLVCNGNDVDMVLNDETQGLQVWYGKGHGCNAADTYIYGKINFNVTSSNATGCHIYYGNPTATKYKNNTDKIFLAFDDFTNELSQTRWIYNGGFGWNSSGFVCLNGTAAQNLLMNLSNQEMPSFEVKYSIKQSNVAAANVYSRVGLCANGVVCSAYHTFSGTSVNAINHNCEENADKTNWFLNTTLLKQHTTNYQTNVWHNLSFKRFINGNTNLYFDNSYTPTDATPNSTALPYSSYTQFGVGIRNSVAGEGCWDNVLLRLAMDYPPTISLLAEEILDIKIIQHLEAVSWNSTGIEYSLNVSLINLGTINATVSMNVDNRFNSSVINVSMNVKELKSYRFTNVSLRATSDYTFNITAANASVGTSNFYSNRIGMFVPGLVGGVGEVVCLPKLRTLWLNTEELWTTKAQ